MKFWRKKSKSDETEISITKADLKSQKSFYVKAQTSEKAMEIIRKLQT